MADRSSFVRESVDAGDNTAKTFAVIPTNERVYINYFGGMDRKLDSSGRGSTYVLQWGEAGNWEDILVISCVSNTVCLPVLREFIGDGTKRFRVIMFNDSTTNKELAFWYKAKSVS